MSTKSKFPLNPIRHCPLTLVLSSFLHPELHLMPTEFIALLGTARRRFGGLPPFPLRFSSVPTQAIPAPCRQSCLMNVNCRRHFSSFRSSPKLSSVPLLHCLKAKTGNFVPAKMTIPAFFGSARFFFCPRKVVHAIDFVCTSPGR